jgi:SAM-dependent methyltransferase
MAESRIGEAAKNEAYIRTVIYDGLSIPFRNRFFRTVVVNSVLEHVGNVRAVISEIHRVLNSGGTCYATVMAAPWEEYLFGAKLFGDWYRRWMKKKQVHINLFTLAEWKKEFSRAGFTIVSVTPYCGPRASLWLDILHYVSLPNLLTYTLWKRWVIWPSLTQWYPASQLAALMDEAVDPKDASALFFVLKRK